MENNNINKVLNERGNRYGDFKDHANIAQRLKRVAQDHGLYSNQKFENIHKESIDMIFHKIARIINGDPNYDDSWIDIEGYAKLVTDHIHKNEKEKKKIKVIRKIN